MQLQKMLLGIIASASVVSLGIAGCTSPQLEAQAPTSTTQSPAAPTTPPQERQPDVPYRRFHKVCAAPRQKLEK